MLEKQENAEIQAKKEKAHQYLEMLSKRKETQFLTEIHESFSEQPPRRTSRVDSPMDVSSQALSVIG